MIDYKINKTEILAEETEKRVRVLENKNQEKEDFKTIEESQTIIVKNGNTMNKYIDFYCNEQTGVVFDLSVASLPETMVVVRVLLNGKTVLQYPKSTSLNEKINLLAKEGKNQIKLIIKFTIGSQFPIVDFNFKLTGDFVYKEPSSFLEPLEQNFIVIHSADSISFYDTANFEIKNSFIGSKEFSCAILSNGNVAVLVKNFDDTNKLIVYNKDDFSVVNQINLTEKFTSCKVRKVGDYYSLYFLKGNFIYERVYSQESTYSQTKLPFKAKNISVFSGGAQDYFCYEDLFGNFVVSIIKQGLPFEKIKTYTFGKIKNPKVYEVGGVCFLSYKCGQLVVERQLEANSNLTILGVGDEGLKLTNGKVVLLNKQKITLI